VTAFLIINDFPNSGDDPGDSDPNRDPTVDRKLMEVYDVIQQGDYRKAAEKIAEIESEAGSGAHALTKRQHIRLRFFSGIANLEKPHPNFAHASDDFAYCLERIENDPAFPDDSPIWIQIRYCLCRTASLLLRHIDELLISGAILKFLDDLQAHNRLLKTAEEHDSDTVRCQAQIWRSEAELAINESQRSYNDINIALALIKSWHERSTNASPASQSQQTVEQFLLAGFDREEALSIFRGGDVLDQTWIMLYCEAALLYARVIGWSYRAGASIGVHKGGINECWNHSGAIVYDQAEKLDWLIAKQPAARRKIEDYLRKSQLLVVELMLLLGDDAPSANLSAWLQASERSHREVLRLLPSAVSSIETIDSLQIEMLGWVLRYWIQHIAGPVPDSQWRPTVEHLKILVTNINNTIQHHLFLPQKPPESHHFLYLKGICLYYIGRIYEIQHDGQACDYYRDARDLFRDASLYVHALWKKIARTACERLRCDETSPNGDVIPEV
jgi:hypothetical protein